MRLEHSHSSEIEVDSSVSSGGMPDGNRETLSRIEKSLSDINDLTDQCMKFVFPLLATDPGQARMVLVNLLNDKVLQNQELEAIFEDLGFVKGNFPDQPDWALLGQNLSDAKKSLETSAEEFRHLGKRKRAGRPFGSRNKLVDVDDGFEALKENKKRSRSKKTGDEGADEATKKSKTKKSDSHEQAFPQDPEHELDEEPKEPNKAGVISLYTKCQVVECAKRLREEGQTACIEKEVMTRFKQYFLSPKTERWKTGLLHKWTQSLFLC